MKDSEGFIHSAVRPFLTEILLRARQSDRRNEQETLGPLLQELAAEWARGTGPDEADGDVPA